MEIYQFQISEAVRDKLLYYFPNMGKNSDVGNVAIKIVELYFKSIYTSVRFSKGVKGADIEISYEGKSEFFEVKGTADSDVCWSKLKVSSQACHDALQNGMRLIRVSNVGTTMPILHFLKCHEDFELVPELRWAVKPLRR